jgi:alpha-D-xyloside xylohydrolase
MLGESILVAPIFNADGIADFYLPEGKWTSLINGESIQGGSWRSERHGYSSLPLYIRESTLSQNGAELNPIMK